MMQLSKIILLSVLAGYTNSIFAQTLPDQMQISADGTRLTTGGFAPNEFYDLNTISSLNLLFDDADYWSQLLDNYEDKTDIPATLIYNGDTLNEKVGVRFKGQTSYFLNNTEKKSFNITLDYIDSTQDIHGYNTLNLNCGYDDPSFMREAVYENAIQKFIPGLAVNYIHLYLNNEDWGIYLNVEQLNKDFIKEWFMTNNGSLWRAEKEGPGGGDPFGAGFCSLNYLGDETDDYSDYYQLKFSDKLDPLTDILEAADALNNTDDELLVEELNKYLDIDRTLWYLACEIIFADDDSYVNKGGMDYYVYWEIETDRITPLEYDGNSCMDALHANWSPFYKITDSDFPLMHILLNNDVLRQRYLAHVRTIIEYTFNPDSMSARIDLIDNLINELINDDPKKIYTYTEYLAEVTLLKEFVDARYDFYLVNTEVNVFPPIITNPKLISENGEWSVVNNWESPTVTAGVTASEGLNIIYLYYSDKLFGTFNKTTMYDDGMHEDGAAADGVFGAAIPGYMSGSKIRFYIEAIDNSTTQTRAYLPPGAEHDVFYYEVGGQVSVTNINKINTLNIFPNPALNTIQVLTSNTISNHLIIYTTDGRMMVNIPTYSSGNAINVNNLPAGCYLIIIQNKLGQQTATFVKE